MKNKKYLSITIVMVLLIALSACSNKTAQVDKTESVDASVPVDKTEHADKTEPVDKTASSSKPTGQIYLYGEQHGVKKILDKELEFWCDYYNKKNMRHLFIEYPYYTAEFLNLWMKSDNDDIFDELYDDWTGTLGANIYTKEFFKKIKSECPETIFHGTDVGHQYDTTGERYLEYLENNNLKDSEQYSLAQEIMEQGRYYYKNSDDVYRENKMVENFVREFDKLNGESIMGIYGQAHTGLDSMDYTNSVACMANQLKQQYADLITSEDLCWLTKDIEPSRVDIIIINEKDYKASYFGKQDLTGFKDYVYREVWRLEDSYNDFKDNAKTGDVLPYDDYSMLIEKGQVFVVEYKKTDGSIKRMYYRSDGGVWNNKPTTEEFTIE